VVWLAGCAGGSFTGEVPLHEEAVGSPRIPFTYRVPLGWFDMSPGADTTQNLVWLVRGDYSATMAVREISLDDEARRRLDDDGMRPVAELSLGLAGADPAISVLTPLERVTGAGGYAFEEVNTATGDTTRVEILGVAGRVFEVQALLLGGGKGAPRESVFTVQRGFVDAFRW
jgi:hypothetical protein